MKKEEFVKKLLENGFILEKEWSEDGVLLYHNKQLKSPIFLIDKWDMNSEKVEDLKLNENIEEILRKSHREIRYEKKIVAVIYDTGSTSSIDMISEMSYCIKFTPKMSSYYPLKSNKNVKINFLTHARSIDFEHDLLLDQFKNTTENGIEIFKLVQNLGDEKPINILIPIGLSSDIMYFLYLTFHYYTIKEIHAK